MPRTLRRMLAAVSCGILLAARAEEIELGIGAALSESATSGFIDSPIGAQTIPEPSTQVLSAVGAMVAGIFARPSRRR